MSTESYKTLFCRACDASREADAAELSERISIRVAGRIERARGRRLRMRIAGHSLVVIAALAAFVPAIRDLSAGLTGSGFSAYASLVMSDGGYLLSSWKEVILSLLESLPIVSSIAVVTLILVFVNSLKRDAGYISSLAHRRHIALA